MRDAETVVEQGRKPAERDRGVESPDAADIASILVAGPNADHESQDGGDAGRAKRKRKRVE